MQTTTMNPDLNRFRCPCCAEKSPNILRMPDIACGRPVIDECCVLCYADGVGHGGVPDTLADAEAFVRDAFGQWGEGYYSVAHVRDVLKKYEWTDHTFPAE